MLDQARRAIGEAAHEQYIRRLIRQADMADQVGRMTARFLAARDEAEIFDAFLEGLPKMGIQHGAVALYESAGADPVAWSVLQTPHTLEEKQRRFSSRRFPPERLYPQDQPFSLALLPLHVQEGVSGFVAFDSGNLEPCADIVRQLAVALRGVRLYREAVEARQLAEEGKRLAEEASRLKSRFLSVVSHELRTPLNLICGLSDMLLRESQQIGPQECKVSRKDLERIYAGAQHLDGLIRDVLDLARSDVGQLKLLCEPLDLTEVLRAVSVIGEQLARDKELDWRAEIPPTLPQVWGDRTRLRQVLLNLVNNAVKFTARGEIALTAATRDGNVIVTVRDTGLGIPAEEHEIIFDEFRRSARATARGYGGLGLGLAICKRLIEMHGGTIGVRSSGEEGEGSTFYSSLPVMQRRETYSDARVTPRQHVALLLRDVVSGDVLKKHLATQGFEVAVYHVNESADWLTPLLLTPPEVVVLDLGLTSERGWEILKILKENPATHDLPVLFYRLASDEGHGSLLEIDYLTKPVGTAALVEALMCQGLLGRGSGDYVDRKILIVDDEPGVLEMHARIVETQLPGTHVLCAKNGLEALETIRQQRPDLVLLDLMMPELDGFGVLEAMRADEVSRSIPVIVLTGQALTEEDMARLNRGVTSVLQKGLFTVEETLERMTAALARRRKPCSETYRAVLKAMAYIHDHYSEAISRSDVAKHVGLSERHLTRCFRQETGLTPIEYLNRYRVKRAKALLEAGDKSITEVAMEVGFSTSGYFTRVFRQEVGVSPRAYRRGSS
jgi:signal transduction histidine kinase/DNA-binding response OmpR family regulator